MQVYDVVINGMTTTIQLSDEDAKVRGLVPQAKTTAAKKATTKAAAAPRNKARA